MKTQHLFSLTVVILALSFPSCKKDSLDETPVDNSSYYYPPLSTDTWQTIAPDALGWNNTKLNELVSYVGSNNSDAFIILYKGRIVMEKYWNNSDLHSSNRIFSSTKSMGAFLVGLAQEKGKIDINKPVSDYLGAGWSKASAARENIITIKHLLTMTSGLTESLNYEAEPGTKWFYNTTAYHKIYAVLAIAFGQSNSEYTRELLWSKIGMQDSYWSQEPGFGGAGPSMSCSARDMARFGLMILSDGKWGSINVMQEKGYFLSMINSSQNINPSYGYLWWLNGKSSFTLPGTGPAINGMLLPDAPADLIAALGFGDKKIYVVKSRDLVVVRHGTASNAAPDFALSSFDNEIWKRLMAAIPK